MKYRVAVVGASFAGVAIARQIREKILVLDRAEPGEFQSSACGLPTPWVEYLGLENSILYSSNLFRCVMNGYEIPLEIGQPFCTIDYKKFCEAGIRRDKVDFVRAKVHKIEGQTLHTEAGLFEADVIVNASGWNAVDRPGPPPPKGVGIETELPSPVSAFEFHFDSLFIRRGYGYAWAFPCGATTRFGVIKFYGRHNLKDILSEWLDQKGLKIGTTHGGAVPYLPQGPLVNGPTFLTGDAAGQCFALTGEGIRPTLYFATYLGWLLQEWLDGRRSLDEVRTTYKALAQSHERKLRAVWTMQRMVNRWPLPVMGTFLRLGTKGPLFKLAARKYLGCFQPPTDFVSELNARL